MPKMLAAAFVIATFLAHALAGSPAAAMPIVAPGGAAAFAPPLRQVANVCGLNGCVAVHVRRAQPVRKPSGMAHPVIAAAAVVPPASPAASNPLANLGSKILQVFHLGH